LYRHQRDCVELIRNAEIPGVYINFYGNKPLHKLHWKPPTIVYERHLGLLFSFWVLRHLCINLSKSKLSRIIILSSGWRRKSRKLIWKIRRLLKKKNLLVNEKILSYLITHLFSFEVFQQIVTFFLIDGRRFVYN
jgi:hypothetical protein